jgi:hypothetical protein
MRTPVLVGGVPVDLGRELADGLGGEGAEWWLGRSSWSVAAILGTWFRFWRVERERGPLLKDQICGRMS